MSFRTDQHIAIHNATFSRKHREIVSSIDVDLEVWGGLRAVRDQVEAEVGGEVNSMLSRVKNAVIGAMNI